MNQFVSFAADTVATALTVGTKGFSIFPEPKLPDHLNGFKAKPREGYYSMFSFLEAKPTTFKGWSGVHKLTMDLLVLDFDSKEDVRLARQDAEKFISDFGLGPTQYALFESGSKGYHLYLHASLFGDLLSASPDLANRCKRFAESLGADFPRLDQGIFDIPRKFRIPYSVHPKTGRQKTLDRGSWPLVVTGVNEALQSRFMAADSFDNAPDLQASAYDPSLEGPVLKQMKALQNKPCVEKMLGTKFPGKRHDHLLLLTLDLYHSGHSRKELMDKLKPFLALNPSPDNDPEIASHIKDLVAGSKKQIACTNPMRNVHCAAYCPVFAKLSTDTKNKQMPMHAYKPDAPADYKPEYRADYLAEVAANEALQSQALGSGSSVPAKKKKEKAPAPEIPGELRIVRLLLSKYGDKIIKQNKDIFIYDGVRWKHFEPILASDHFKKQIDAAAYGKMKFKDITSGFNRLLMHIPNVPEGVDMFTPNPHRMNFTNGCLHLDRQADGTYSLALHPHSPTDYLTLVHPFDYIENAAPNLEFEQALDRIWEGDPDIEAKKAAYFEVLGASLVPTFRKIVLFVGPAKTGKSTLIQFATSLVHKELSCSVDPSQMQGFNMQSMAGKLLNYDTDISLSQSLSDSVLKKVEDMIPVRIARKNMSDIYAPIPPMHIFGANKLPQSKDGAEVYDRRMILIRCTHVIKGDSTGRHTQDYASLVWGRGASGILGRAIEGLKRLCANGGHFTEPASSVSLKETWVEGDKDIVELFLEWLGEKPEREVLDEEAIVSDKTGPVTVDFRTFVHRAFVGAVFKTFLAQEQYLHHSGHKITGRNKLYSRLSDLGAESRVSRGIREMKIVVQFPETAPQDLKTTPRSSGPSY
jgi:phage/plasmid-associated DNA primase